MPAAALRLREALPGWHATTPAEVARHIGSDHRELQVNAADASGLLDTLVSQYDEPFADSSALPTL